MGLFDVLAAPFTGAATFAGLKAISPSSGGSTPSGSPFGYMDPKYSDLASFGKNPYASSLEGMISNFKMPGQITAGSITPGQVTADSSAYQAKDTSKMALPQYDAMRTRLNAQLNQTQGQAQDAIDRQFAAMGGGPGNGAQLKQTENLASGMAQQRDNAMQDINAQEQQTRQALQQQEEQRAFESSEAQKGRMLQAGEFNVGAKNAAEQFNAQLGFGAQQFNTQMGLEGQKMAFDMNSTLAGLNTAWDQSQQQSVNDAFNKEMAAYQSEHSGGLLGGGGFLGLGI